MDKAAAELLRALRADFKVYAPRCLKIRTKSGSIEPLVLNQAQEHIHARLEEDFDDAKCGEGLRLDVFNVIDGGTEGALINVNHTTRHVIRLHARIGPDHTDDGNADVRKNIGRRAQCGERSENEDQYRQHGEGVRAPQRQLDELVHVNRPFNECPLDRGCCITALHDQNTLPGTANSANQSDTRQHPVNFNA